MRNCDDVLAIERESYRRWREDVAKYATSELFSRSLEPEAATRLIPGRKSVGDVAVIPLQGFITQKPNLFTMLFGGTSTEALAIEIQKAMLEPSIGAVVLDVDSPGGQVFGLPEAAAAIRQTRGAKPLLAVSNPLMASAAYWLGSQADEIVATPSSLTGSIGVLSVYVDESKALEKAGLEIEEIVFGRRKAEASGLKPLTAEAREAIQERVDYFGTLFERDVARGRGVGARTVSARFGQGAIFTAEGAQAAGLVDRVDNLGETVRALGRGYRPALRAARAENDPVELAARAALAGLDKMR